ncbi:glycosyltransferase family 2 protein [Haloflavibacter putidus]|uniref:Glycosyltransferase family 2 protein n=1 Tax=Haloflavibacter putidus TaxID=2576776 RepID=A0A507ZAT0_9FLAO|nr:glycosyltransferase family 2 protein [Haloflavibacter putidus]TQD33811.1 glycosyltransferase family 2 protein [Haloflavibacter putidus]
MSKHPLVSIIIPTLNRADLIAETLGSIKEQEYQNWECIIIDDGSTDNTIEVVKAFSKEDKRFSVFSRPANYAPGGNGARNYGFRKSQGTYIQWFDSDDIMLSTKLAEEVKTLEKHNLDFVISSGYSADNKLQNLKEKHLDVGQDLYVNYTTWKSKIFLPSICFKSTFIRKYKLFNEKLLRGQENEFFSRVFYKSRKFAKYFAISGFHYIYRQHDNNKRSRQRNQYISAYMNSFVFLSLENFKRGKEIASKEVINFHYKNLLAFFYLALNNNDKNLCKQILSDFLPFLWQTNKRIAFAFFVAGHLSLIRGNSIYFLEQKLKNTVL